MKQLNKIIRWMPIVAILITGCNPNLQNQTSENKLDAVRVKVLQVGTSTSNTEPSYVATIEESVLIPLSFLTLGTVDKVLVGEGQTVTQGQLLAVLNNKNHENAYQIALSKENQAQDAYNRLEPVYQKGSLPEVKFVEIKTGLEMAKSAVLIAKKNLDDCRMYAPTSGVIGKRMLEPGMSVLPGNPVFRLVKIEKVNANVPVPENEISTMKKGQKAHIHVSALGNRQFEGEIKEIGVLSNPLSHTYMVKVELINPEKVLKPGMVCKVTIGTSSLENRIIVPVSAIQIDSNGKKFVFVANPNTNKAVKKPVEVGPLHYNGVVISSGLKTNDLLITEGYQKINENTTIQIVR